MIKAIYIAIAIVIIAGIAWSAKRQPSGPEPSPSPTATATATPSQSASPAASPAGKKMKLQNGLEIQDIVVGTGAQAKAGMVVSVHYTGTFADGKKFDSSLDRGQPFSFTLGAGEVIQGWDIGVEGMKVGGKRKLIIPPALAYGAGGVPGAIPPNSTLYFDVELLAVQ